MIAGRLILSLNSLAILPSLLRSNPGLLKGKCYEIKCEKKWILNTLQKLVTKKIHFLLGNIIYATYFYLNLFFE